MPYPAQTLLRAKLMPPPLRAGAVARPRLTRRLAEGARGALTLLSAPAGYGKTTLLAQWCAARAGEQLPTAWLSLDGDDNDPVRFMARLSALVSAPPVAPPRRSSAWKPWLIALLNQIAALDTPLVLVLDDFHHVTSPSIYAALSYLLDHRPASLYLVIAARAEPPLPIARLRAAGQLAELRAAQLAFDEREAAAFLSHTVGLQLSAGDMATFFALTEGWPSGLQLATSALQDLPAARAQSAHVITDGPSQYAAAFANNPAQPTGAKVSDPAAPSRAITDGPGQPALAITHDPAWPALPAQVQQPSGAPQPALAGFSGRHRYVFDYLIDQVILPQPADVQLFMMQASLLDRLNAPLCAALTGRADSAQLLDALERANLFLCALDAQPQAYRFHPLMAACLRERLHVQFTPDEVRRLHGRASEWYEQQCAPPLAIHHALAAADFERAAMLVDRAAEQAMARGEVAVILHWLTALPEAIVRVRPGLCVWYAWALCLTAHWQRSEPWLLAAERQLQDALTSTAERAAHGRSKLAEIAAIRALAARLRGDLSASIYQAQCARDGLRGTDLIVLGAVAQSLGAAYVEVGSYQAGSEALAEAERASLAAGHPYLYVVTLLQRARLCMRQSRLPEAIALYRHARAHAASEGLSALDTKISAELAGVLATQRVLLDPLTRRELDVLRLVAAGRSTFDVAAELVISAGTVRNHLKSIYGKLGAHTRLQAVAHARALAVL